MTDSERNIARIYLTLGAILGILIGISLTQLL